MKRPQIQQSLPLLKILLLGDGAVGKSSLMLRFCEEKFDPRHIVTIGVDFRSKPITLEDGTRVKIQIWDTAGQERFRNITPVYFRSAMGVVLVFDVSTRSSFKTEHADKSICRILVGNKIDLPRREVSQREAQALADFHDIAYMECSALKNLGINEIFRLCAHVIWQRRCARQAPKTGPGEKVGNGANAPFVLNEETLLAETKGAKNRNEIPKCCGLSLSLPKKEVTKDSKNALEKPAENRSENRLENRMNDPVNNGREQVSSCGTRRDSCERSIASPPSRDSHLPAPPDTEKTLDGPRAPVSRLESGVETGATITEIRTTADPRLFKSTVQSSSYDGSETHGPPIVPSDEEERQGGREERQGGREERQGEQEERQGEQEGGGILQQRRKDDRLRSLISGSSFHEDRVARAFSRRKRAATSCHTHRHTRDPSFASTACPPSRSISRGVDRTSEGDRSSRVLASSLTESVFTTIFAPGLRPVLSPDNGSQNGIKSGLKNGAPSRPTRIPKLGAKIESTLDIKNGSAGGGGAKFEQRVDAPVTTLRLARLSEAAKRTSMLSRKQTLKRGHGGHGDDEGRGEGGVHGSGTGPEGLGGGREAGSRRKGPESKSRVPLSGRARIAPKSQETFAETFLVLTADENYQRVRESQELESQTEDPRTEENRIAERRIEERGIGERNKEE